MYTGLHIVITITLPVVYMAQNIMILMQTISIMRTTPTMTAGMAVDRGRDGGSERPVPHPTLYSEYTQML